MKHLVASLVSVAAIHAAEPPLQTMAEIAKPWQQPPGAPRHSDVCFSPRFVRKDVDAFAKMAEFHGTRLDWVYATRDFIAECARRGLVVSHCTSPSRPDDGPVRRSYKTGRAEDIHGKPLVADWQDWNPGWGCYSQPDFFKMMESDVFLAIDSGAAYMHMDDPDVAQMLRWGGEAKQPETSGCFCAPCLKNFRAHLAKLTAEELKTLGVQDAARFDYKQFLLAGQRNAALRKHYEACYRETVRTFLTNLRKSADARAGRRFPFACNNGSYTTWDPPHDLFDFGVGELSDYDPPTPLSLWKKARNITRLGKGQAFTLRSDDVGQNQRVLSLSCCLGMNFIVPWNVWLKGSERFFGEPRDYAHLFAFVRDNARWLDGYEYAAAIGKGIRDDLPGGHPPVTITGNDDACAFVRAAPGQRAAVVVHLFDDGEIAKPFRVTLDNARFFPGKRLACRLLSPAQQSSEEHALAEKTKDFSKFTHAVELAHDGSERQTVLEIPALKPWALLLITPAD